MKNEKDEKKMMTMIISSVNNSLAKLIVILMYSLPLAVILKCGLHMFGCKIDYLRMFAAVTLLNFFLHGLMSLHTSMLRFDIEKEKQ